ncbi:hypothetical protein MYP_896 [Sporocytophaga myxococcoides]|uniref:Uncharacterized protein n=1 Tax=Sporocytophaga myxococcoides TaxID=153721 RepID=A0A098LB55_9BACT
MRIFEKIENNEVYLYMDGKLRYKRWLDSGQSKVFDIMAYDQYTLASFRDWKYEGSNGLISIKAKLTMKKTEDGGRKTGFTSGYRPNHVFQYKDSGHLLMTFIDDI